MPHPYHADVLALTAVQNALTKSASASVSATRSNQPCIVLPCRVVQSSGMLWKNMLVHIGDIMLDLFIHIYIYICTESVSLSVYPVVVQIVSNDLGIALSCW